MRIDKNIDLLIVIDFLNDFISGSLAVPGAEELVPVINEYLRKFNNKVFVMESHPKDHSSFIAQGGPWPVHCEAGTYGAMLHKGVKIDWYHDTVITKGNYVGGDGYSGFENPDLLSVIEIIAPNKVFICGLATDYCVRATVLDALKQVHADDIYLLTDAIKAVNVKPTDGEKAIEEMSSAGAIPTTLNDIE